MQSHWSLLNFFFFFNVLIAEIKESGTLKHKKKINRSNQKNILLKWKKLSIE